MTPATPWPVVVTAEPLHSSTLLQHAETVITIPCTSPEARTDEALVPTWLELLGQR